MANTRKKIKEKPARDDLRKWLLGIQRGIGSSVIISLLIEKDSDKVTFIMATNKARLITDDDTDSEESFLDYEKIRSDVKTLDLNRESYIG